MPERLNIKERKSASWRHKIGMLPKEAVLVRLQIQI
jgi:hypothetical protein